MNIIFRSYIYDALYAMADQLIKKHNPCQIHKDISGKVHCLRSSPCCGGCGFLGPDGCTTKCLGCKLSLCQTTQETNPGLDEILIRMKDISWAYGLRGIRISKKELFDCLKRESRVEKTYKKVISNTIKDLKAVLEKSGGN